MSYYRDSVRDDYDDYDRPVTIKRYVVGSDDHDRRDDRRDDLVIRRRTDREEPLEVQRYKREVDYFPPSRRYEDDYYDPRQSRESEYDLVRRSDYDDDAYYRRRYDDRRSHRDISPGDSISQASRRHRSDRDRDDYSSDDSMVYVRKETRDYDDDHPHHRRHMAEGALVGMGAAELVRSRSRRGGKEVSHGINHAAKTAGAGALGAVAVNAASHVRDYYRSKSRSRHRSHSFDDDRSSRHHRHRSRGRYSGSRSRSRSRSHSHSRAKTLLELGVGAAAVAAGVAALRNNNKDKDERRARSRSRSKSRGRGLSSTRSRSEKGNDDDEMSRRRKHMVEAGAAGAALGGIAQYARSRSRSGRHRSQSRIRQALPAVVAGLGTAAATGLYEKNKAKKDEKEMGEGKSRERRHSRSRSRPPSEAYPDPSRDSAGLIEYGNGGVTGSIPADHYYGQPASPGAPYYSDGPRSSRSRSQSRHRGHRSRSRGRYSDSPDESDRERRHSRHGHRSRGDQDPDGARYDAGDPYGDLYNPGSYPEAPVPPHQHPDNYFPHTNTFPPPPQSTTNLNPSPSPYNPADYPPPPGAAPPPQPYNYGASGQAPETYAPRPRRADDNVSSNPSDQHPRRHGGFEEPNAGEPKKVLTKATELENPEKYASVSIPGSHPSKSVAFDLETPQDRGYETDDSDSSRNAHGNPSHHTSRHHRSSSLPNSRHQGHSSSSSLHSRYPHLRSQTSLSDDSESTIDLPDRFDKHGQRLPQGDDVTGKTMEELLQKFSRVFV